MISTCHIGPWRVEFQIFFFSFFFFFDTIPDIFQYDGFDRFIGNKDLCGDIKGFAPCPPSSKTMAK